MAAEEREREADFVSTSHLGKNFGITFYKEESLRLVSFQLFSSSSSSIEIRVMIGFLVCT